MRLLLPALLLALLTLPLILLLHMLRQRRRRVRVPSLLLWLAAQQVPSGQRPRHIPLTLLLLLHLLIAALIGFAATRPQLAADAGDQRHLAIVLDASTSMAADERGGRRIDSAREEIAGLLADFDAEDEVTLVLAGARPQILAEGSPDAVLAALADVQPGGSSAPLDSALALAEATLPQDGPRQLIVFTDAAWATEQQVRAGAPVEWRIIGAPQQNRAIVTFATKQWGGNLQLYARIANYGDEQLSTPVRLLADELVIDTRQLTVEPGGSGELSWTVPDGVDGLRLEIEGDDALPLDDQASLGAPLPREINVALVSPAPEALSRALQAIPGVNVSEYESVRRLPLAVPPDLTIYHQVEPRLTGGPLLIIAPPETDLFDVRGSERPEGPLRKLSPLIADLALEGVTFRIAQEITPPEGFEVLLSSGELPLMLRGTLHEQPMAIWAFDHEESTLPTRLAFPLLVARTVRDLAPSAPPSAVEAGGLLSLRPSPQARTIVLRGPDGQLVEAASAPALAIEAPSAPGSYTIEERGSGGLIFSAVIGVNAGAAPESNLLLQSEPPSLTAPATTAAEPRWRDLWPWLALLGLLVLLGEWAYVLLRGRSEHSEPSLDLPFE